MNKRQIKKRRLSVWIGWIFVSDRELRRHGRKECFRRACQRTKEAYKHTSPESLLFTRGSFKSTAWRFPTTDIVMDVERLQ